MNYRRFGHAPAHHSSSATARRPTRPSFRTRSFRGLIAALFMLAGGALLPTTATAQAFGFGAPSALNSNAATDSGIDSAARLATDAAGNWIAVWYSNDDLGGTIGADWDILVARSTNNGASWSTTAALNSNASTDSGSDQLPDLATDGAGNWIAVWRSNENLGSTIGTDVDILFARSTDNGATWSAPAALNSNATTDSGSDLSPRLKTDGAGNWVATWRSNDSLGGTIGTDYDILFARSTNNGTSWTAPAPLNSNAASDSGNDTDPQLSTDGAGNWVAVWQSQDSLGGTIGTDADILVARSTNDGATWSAPAPLHSNAASDVMGDLEPTVTTDGLGNWVAAWFSLDDLGGTIGTDWDILVVRSTDNGATWTAPTALNGNATTDSGDDASPQLATDGTGNWVAVWSASENLGGTIGTDFDCLIAGSTDNGASWTFPAALNSNASFDSGNDFSPQLKTDNAGNWISVWNSTDSLGGTIGGEGDILSSSSAGLPVELSGFSLD